jgi:hypothetical protein
MADEAFQLTSALLQLDREQDVPRLGAFNRKFEAGEEETERLSEKLITFFTSSAAGVRLT